MWDAEYLNAMFYRQPLVELTRILHVEKPSSNPRRISTAIILAVAAPN